MQDRPTAAEALDAVASFLREDVVGGASPGVAFGARVAANLLRIVERELRDGPELDRAEHARLVAILGRDGDLAELNRELAARLRRRELDPASPALHAHLRITARDRVAIANPRYLAATDPG